MQISKEVGLQVYRLQLGVWQKRPNACTFRLSLSRGKYNKYSEVPRTSQNRKLKKPKC